MNWFWLRSRRRVPSAGCLPHGSAGRLAWRKAARPIGYAGLSVALAAVAAGCTGSPGSSGQGPATTAVSPSLLISRTAPDVPVGRQLTWFLRAVAEAPWSQQVIRAHFDSGFLAQISPAQLNSGMARLPAALGTSVPASGASLIGLLSEDPARDPDSLLAVAAFGTVTVAAGQISWTQDLTVTDALKSAGNIGPGYLQYDPAGTRVSVRQTALQMISMSDNTAADMLIHLVGRSAVQAQDRQWSAHAALNVPFLTTRELFLLKYADPLLAGQYLRLAPGQRAAFLASSVDPLPLSQAQVQSAATASPADIDTLEWFASPDDICRAFAGLQQLAARPGLAPLDSILSANNGGIGLGPALWPTVWFKGGSEPGVATVGYLATNSKGQTFVVVVMLSDPSAALSPSAVAGLLAIVRGAFGLVR